MQGCRNLTLQHDPLEAAQNSLSSVMSFSIPMPARQIAQALGGSPEPARHQWRYSDHNSLRDTGHST